MLSFPDFPVRPCRHDSSTRLRQYGAGADAACRAYLAGFIRSLDGAAEAA